MAHRIISLSYPATSLITDVYSIKVGLVPFSVSTATRNPTGKRLNLMVTFVAQMSDIDISDRDRSDS